MHNEINGILVVDKEKGMTSHDVVDAVRKRFRVKKVGHAGTLDPGATGVLVLLLGKATKLSGTYINDDKEYIAEMRLGTRTSSGDAEGVVLRTSPVDIGSDRVEKVMASFRGEISQVPPMVSAKKIGGKKLYELARKGLQVERKPVKVRVDELEILSLDLPVITFRVVCSKGTYIRQLADDIGEKLGCGAHLTELRRTRSGDFTIESSVSWKTVKELSLKGLDENISRI